MKKIMILAASAALVLAGCAKNDVFQNTTDQNAVSFGVYVPKSVDTKATYGTQTTTTLQTDGFGVLAYYTNDGAYSAAATPNFMYNTKVSTASWTYSPIKYWPNEHGSAAASAAVDKLSFFAYAPWIDVTVGADESAAKTPFYPAADQGITKISGNSATGDPLVYFTVPTKGSEQIDLLWGVAAADATNEAVQGTNTITTGLPLKDLIKQQVDGKVKFDFKHALAKLDFKVQAIVDDDETASTAVAANTKIFVRKVEVIGRFNTSGVLNLNNVSAGVAKWQAPFTTNAGTDPIYIFNDGKSDSDDLTADASESDDIADQFVLFANEGVTKTATKLLKAGKEFMIIPTDLTTNKLTVKVTYDIETADPNLAGTLTDGTTHGIKVKNVITTAVPLAINFENGKVYTIVLKLGLTSVKMEAVVTDWDTTVADVNTDLPKNVD